MTKKIIDLKSVRLNREGVERELSELSPQIRFIHEVVVDVMIILEKCFITLDDFFYHYFTGPVRLIAKSEFKNAEDISDFEDKYPTVSFQTPFTITYNKDEMVLEVIFSSYHLEENGAYKEYEETDGFTDANIIVEIIRRLQWLEYYYYDGFNKNFCFELLEAAFDEERVIEAFEEIKQRRIEMKNKITGESDL